MLGFTAVGEPAAPISQTSAIAAHTHSFSTELFILRLMLLHQFATDLQLQFANRNKTRLNASSPVDQQIRACHPGPQCVPAPRDRLPARLRAGPTPLRWRPFP